MSSNNLIKFIVMMLFVLPNFTCGKSEDKGTEDLPPATSSTQTDKNFTGSLYINNSGQPAKAYSLYLLNHTRNIFTQIVVDNSGNFRIPVTLFRRFEEYTLHIVDENSNYISNITVEEADHFQYVGGVGVDVGLLTIARDSFGVVDTENSEINLVLEDLLSPLDGSTTLEDFEPVDTFSYIKVGSNLVVTDRSDLINGFYRASTNPNLYQQAILNWSGVRISAEFASPVNKTMLGGIVTSGSQVLLGGRVHDLQAISPGAQPTFASKNYNLVALDNKVETTIYPQHILREAEFLTFDIVYFSGLDRNETIRYNFLGKLGATLSMPPLVTGMNQGNATTVPIDYDSSILDNGLTQPFCRTSGDVFLEMEPPENFGGQAFTYDEFTKVTIHFDYYYDLNGKKTLADLETNRDGDPLITSDYPTGYSTGFTNSSEPSATRVWDPHTQNLQFTFTSTGPMVTHFLRVYANIFLSSIPSLNNTPVTETKLNITYDGPKHRAGIVTLFRPCS